MRMVPGPKPPSSVPGPVKGKPTPPQNVGVSLPSNRFYTVRAGDTLYKIAMQFYNYPDWPRIYNANTGTIANPDVLTPGTTILIP